MQHSKGFITIASGKEEYYRMAVYLLRSYKMFSKDPLPFAILCDRENEYTAQFDNVILFSDGASNTYLDKLELGRYLPYEETLFIDADCLAYGDLNELFLPFQQADDFSCFGRVLPLDDMSGWFAYENLGALKERVSYVVGLHGGIYYMRRSEKTASVFETAKMLLPDYSAFHFKGKFSSPGDEPLIALSMAINKCKPIPFQAGTICCYWEHTDEMRIDVSVPDATIMREVPESVILMHWGTRYTRGLVYQKQTAMIDILSGDGDIEKQLRRCRRSFAVKMAQDKCRTLVSRAYHKMRRIMAG